MRTSSERHRRARLGAAIAAWTLAAALAAPVVVAAMSDALEVRLLIFSGRENPSFVLTDAAQIATLRSLVAALEPNPGFRQASVTPSILGYNGFVVVNGAGVEGLPGQLAVYREDVQTRADGIAFYRDPDRALERWLVEQVVDRKLVDARGLELIRGR